jgi:hypothetical protein
MTPEEQWAIINVATFDQAVFAKIKGVMTAMASAEVEADEIRTNVQGVPLTFAANNNSTWLETKIGKDAQNAPLVSMTIPLVWLEA